VYNYHDSHAYGYKWSRILFWVDGMVWDGWNGFGLACVESYDLYNPFVDHTLRLIQHNWVVLAYNFYLVILVLIIGESSIGAFLLTILL
jgi:hypothetical protein